MLADLTGLYADAGMLADWVEANAAEYKTGFSTNVVVDAQGNMSDVPVKRAKPLAFATRLAAFRTRFGPKPA